MSASRWLCGLAAWIVFAAGPLLVFGGQEPLNASLPNFDKRRELLKGAAAPNAVRRAATDQLKKRVRGLEVRFHEFNGSPKWIVSREEFLSGEKGQGRGISPQVAQTIPETEPHRAVKAFLREHRDLFGHGPEALDLARIKRSFTNAHNGLGTTVWEQEFEGVPVFDSLFAAHTTTRGELAAVSSQFVSALQPAADKGLPNWRANKANPKVSARRALVLAAKNLGFEIQEASLEEQRPERDPRVKLFKVPNRALPGRAQLWWVPMDESTLRLAWEIYATGPPSGELYRLFVDCETGEVLMRHCRTAYLSDVSYRVFTTSSPAPMSPGLPAPATNQAPRVSRTLVTLPALSTNASPIGWISDGETETRGNNIDAHLDRNADDQPDLPRPQSSPGRVFDPPLDLSQSPLTYGDASVVQLFYWCNWMHDQLYNLGFTEAAGNFQKDNFGRGGLDNDPVIANAQDGSGLNNARFFQAPDGYPGRIEMFLFDGPDPDLDGSLDADIVLHEYTHGLTDRLVGGGAGIYQWVTFGLAEGWSDFYALAMLADPSADADAVYTEGGYATYQYFGLQQNYYFGIRRYPYTTDMSKNPLTFKDIDPAQIGPYPAVPMSPLYTFNPGSASEPHRVGEIWCNTLWQARANLIHKYGPAGNQLILQLVTEGLRLSPPNPTILQARDAILLADRIHTGGANQLELWAAFAKRGMGVNASEGPNWTTEGAHESFDRPDALLVTPFASIVFSGPVGGPFAPNCRTILLSNSTDQPLPWIAGGADPYLMFSPSQATLPPGASATISVCPTPLAASLALGSYNVPVWFSNEVSGVVHRRDIQLRAMEFASLPFRENFEAPLLASYWQASGMGISRVGLSTNFGPQAGQQHVLMQSGATGFFTRNELTLGVDLAGYTNVLLRFWAKEFNDEPDGPPAVPFYDGDDFDGVAISVDGYVWYEAAGLRRLREDYSEISVNLDDVIRRYGLQYTSTFQVRFNHAGTGMIPNDGIALDSMRIDGIAPRRFTVNLPEGLKESDGTIVGRAEIRLGAPASTQVTVQLSSSDPSLVGVPQSIILNAGADHAVFDLNLVDDDVLEGTQKAAIRASAPGFLAGSGVLLVADDETAIVSVELPASVQEGSGPLGGVAWVRVDQIPREDLVVQLTSSDPASLQVPAGVVIEAGTNTAEVVLDVLDDGARDGAKSVTVTAKLSESATAAATLTVTDNEHTNLALSLPPLLTEMGPTIAAGGVVRISGILPTNLNVTLSATAPETLRVPAFVTIPAGRVSATFSLTVADDLIASNAQQVAVTANAPQFAPATAGLRIVDNDAAPAPYGPSPQPNEVTSQNVQLAWSLGTPEVVLNGDFEVGNLSGWRADVAEPSDIVINNGLNNPPGPEGPTPPYSGRFSALMQASIPGQRTLFQDITIPLYFDSVVLNWTDRIRNHAGAFSDEQLFRVEIRTIDNILLAVPFSTAPGDPALRNWQERSFGLNNFRGSTIRIAFVERDTLGFLNVHLDNIRLMLSSPGPAASELYFGTTPNLGPEQLLSVTSGTTFELPALAMDTSYYWRIVARRGSSRYPGATWEFRTRGIGALDHFEWSSFAPTQFWNQPFPVTIRAKDAAGNTVPGFAPYVSLSASQTQPPETVNVLTFTGFAGREYRNTLAGISTYFTNYVETTFTATETWALEAQLVGKDVFLVPEQPSVENGVLADLGTSWAPVLSNFVSKGGVVVVCSHFRDEHQILNQSGLMQLAKVRPYDNAHLNVIADDPLLDGVPSSFEAPNIAALTSLNGSALVGLAETNAAAVLARKFGNGRVVMLGFDFSENRTPFDRIVANAVRLGEQSSVLSIPVVPPVTGYFDEGVWSGNIALAGVGSNIVLMAEDAAGHRGVSAPVSVLAPSDLSLEITDAVDPILVGSNVVYHLNVRHTAPGTAEAVTIAAPVPAGMSFVRAEPSSGACTLNDRIIQCHLGTLTENASATVQIELTANTAGRVGFAAEVTTSTEEAYTDNNHAAVSTRVLLPAVSIADLVVAEGDTGTRTATISVLLQPPIRQAARMEFATSNLTAIAGLDYEARTGVIVFPPGATNQTLEIPIIGDTIFEGNEVFFVHLSNLSNALPDKVLGTCFITENDPAPVLTIEDTSVIEGGPGTTTQAVFSVKLSTNAAIAVTANYGTTNGSATPVLDFKPTAGAIRLPPGVIRTNVSVAVLGDAASETNETFFVKLSSVQNATVGRAEATGIITDDDVGKVERFAWSPIASPQHYSVPFPVTVTAQDTLGNTALEFSGPATLDGWRASQQITIPPGSNSWEFPMGTYFHDQRLQAIYLASEVGEASRITALSLLVTTVPGQAIERWTLRLKHTPASAFSDAVWEQGWTTVFQNTEIVTSNGWINFQFAEPFEYNGVENLLVDFSFNNATFTSDGQCAFTPTPEHRSLYFRTDSGFGDPLSWDGAEPPAALARRVPSVRFATEKTVAISPAVTAQFTNGVWNGALTVNEVVDNMSIRAQDGRNHFGSANLFSVTAFNDIAVSAFDSPDPGRVGDSITFTYVITNSGPSSASLVALTNVLPASVTFLNANSSQGSCDAQGGIVRCALGSLPASGTATVSVVAVPRQTAFITNEVLVSRGETDAYLGNNRALTVTRVNPLAILVQDATVSELTGAFTNLVFALRLSSSNAEPVSVEYFTSNGTATNDLDYLPRSGVLTFAPGTTNLTVSVPIVGDLMDEPTETFFLNLTNAVNGMIVQARVVGTIVDDDLPPTLTMDDATVLEGHAGNTTLAFPVRLSAPSAQVVIFRCTSSNGTALVGQDYFNVNLPQAFLPGTTNRNLLTTVFGDRTIEPDENFFIYLSQPQNVSFSRVRAQGTIINDDGLPGVLDHFSWNPLPATATVDQPFGVAIAARDFAGTLVSNYSGSVIVAGRVGRPDVAIGSPVSQFRYPLAAGFHDARLQAIYLASELAGPRRIIGLAIEVLTPPGQTLNDWTLRLRHTTRTNYDSFSLWETNGWTTAYQSNATINATGWITFPFATPFDYNGSNNVMVDFSFNNSFFTVDGASRFSATNELRTLVGHSDSEIGAPLNWSGYAGELQVVSGFPMLRFISGFDVPVTPNTSDAFVNGAWSGNVTVLQPAVGMALIADDGLGHLGASDLFNAERAPDSDADGLLDSWELTYFGSLDSPNGGAQADPDHDGMNNLQEYLAGTHPLDATNVLEITHIQQQGATVRISFQSIGGKKYRLERASQIRGVAWATALDDLSGPTGVLDVLDQPPPGAAAFYRVRLLP